ncbi:hypothetical protein F5880DRAFT_1509755 [Lentinula raphanica]|nr:hypothetical protein F5880DRAFT_1509755 [Lentinula raphanica]
MRFTYAITTILPLGIIAVNAAPIKETGATNGDLFYILGRRAAEGPVVDIDKLFDHSKYMGNDDGSDAALLKNTSADDDLPYGTGQHSGRAIEGPVADIDTLFDHSTYTGKGYSDTALLKNAKVVDPDESQTGHYARGLAVAIRVDTGGMGAVVRSDEVKLDKENTPLGRGKRSFDRLRFEEVMGHDSYGDFNEAN